MSRGVNPGTTLSIDTVSPVGGASIFSAREGVLGEVRFRGGRLHSARLMEAVDSLFKITNLKPHDINFVTVSSGPGSFTGLRVGMSTAKGFCYALGVPMVLVSSLEAMAVSAGAFQGLIVPVFDARKKEVYAAVFTSSGEQPERVLDDAPMGIDALIDEIEKTDASKRVLFTGNGAELYRERIVDAFGERAVFAPPHLFTPLPSAVAVLGLSYARKGEFTPPEKAVPLYLRKSEAELTRLNKGSLV